ncbi:MAG TPA: response regulator [Chloroflexia bacterium]|nr:response regulator [Chloroflexia bacterium]
MSLEETRKKLLNKFKEEADIHLLTLQRRLVDLEMDPQNTEYLREVFRAAHTIKGSARLMNFGEISSIAHEMENIFAEMRDGKLTLQAETNDVLFEAVDTINTMIEAAIRGDKSTGIDVPALNARLASIIQPATGAAAPASPAPAPVVVEPVKPAQDAVAQKLVSQPATAPTLAEENGSAEAQPVIPAQPQLRSVGALSDNVIRVDVNKLDELMNITGELVLSKLQTDTTLNNLQTIRELLRQRQRYSQSMRNNISILAQNQVAPDTTQWQEMRDTMAGLALIDAQLEQLLKGTVREYEEQASLLVSRVDELENNVKSIRLLPIETIYQDFPVSVRNMAKSNGREIPDLRQFGGEIELDKKVLEGIRDPLIHIIRNAIDHGIEAPQVRLEAGKPKTGHITMSAKQDGSYVSIEISDDGAGIDPEVIRQVAIRKKFLPENRVLLMSDEDVLNLIYEPGFTTSQIITDLSGRGVGMEIVKTNLERLGGQVSVKSEKGVGTTVTLRVPVTLATSRALLVRISGQLYAILAPAIESMFYLSPDEILTREGREVMLYGNSLIPLAKFEDILGSNRNSNHPIFRYQSSIENSLEPVFSMATLGTLTGDDGGHAFTPEMGLNLAQVGNNGFVGLTLADPTAASAVRELKDRKIKRGPNRGNHDRHPAVVLSSADKKVCFLVDELVDETEIVVKSLGPLLAKTPYITSSTIMGDGQIVLILDVPNLVSGARNAQSAIRKQRDVQAPPKRILVVDDSITTRELERSILEAQGFIVDLADDGTVALEILHRDNSYDLVISDVEMPNMNGFELTANIKGAANLRHLPVIIVSSLNNENYKRQGIDAGAQAYITKGDFEQANLLSTIEYLTS